MDILPWLWLVVWGGLSLYAWYSSEKAKQAPGNETRGSTEGSGDGPEEHKNRQRQVDEYLDMQYWSH